MKEPELSREQSKGKTEEEEEEEESKDEDWDFEREFDDIFDNNSPSKKQSQQKRGLNLDEQSPRIQEENRVEKEGEQQEPPVMPGSRNQEKSQQAKVTGQGALELNSEFDDTDSEANGMSNPLQSGILGKPTDRLDEVGTSEIQISELGEDDLDNGEQLRDEEDAVIQESKKLVQGIHQRYQSGGPEQSDPEQIARKNDKAVKVQGQLDFDTDEDDEGEEQEDLLGADGIELEVTPIIEERKSHLIKQEESSHLEPDCSQLVSEVDQWVTVEDIRSHRKSQRSPQAPIKSERSKVKFQGVLDAGSSFDEEDSKFDPQMDATMSWGDLDRRDSELEQTQSQNLEDEETMGEVANHILQEEVAAVLQIVEARKKF